MTVAAERGGFAGERRSFSREDYHAMGRAGILTSEDRVELLEGAVIVMAPIGSRHAACVARLARAFFTSGRLGRTLVQVQNPLAVSGHSELQPDLMLLAARDDDYAFGHPGAADVLLLVEVADSSGAYDRHTKLPLYAAAGVREAWLVDLEHDRIEASTEPTQTGYRVTRRHAPGDFLAPAALPDLTLAVDRIVPPRPPARR